MFTIVGFIIIGTSLGVLAFPVFALAAVAFSIFYSFYNFDGTITGCIADLLQALATLQLGYFLAVMAIMLYRWVHLVRRNDQ